jgi:hypothetical protein
MALANKKTPRKFIKGRSGGVFDSDKIAKASASMANDDMSNDINMVEGSISPILYHSDLMQEDIDELRRYVTNDISSGGGLTESPLAFVSGRFQWSSADDGERIHIGNTSYGPFNWYSHTSEPSFSTLRSFSRSTTVNTTTATVYEFHHAAYGIYVPDESKKVKARVTFRVQSAPNSSTFGFSMWDATPPTDGQTANSTITLRANSSSTTVNTDSTKTYVEEFTTTNAVSNKTLFFLAENRTGALSTNTYMYFSVQFFLVD